MATKPKNRLLTSERIPCLVYALISIVVLGPLLLPGFILTLDMVFGPHVKLSDWFYGLRTDIWGELPAWGLLAALNHFASMWLLQKLLLFTILFLAGYSAYRLSPSQQPLGRYFTGLLYMLNPFVYVRFMAGQWQFLAGYALAPLAIKAIISLAQRPRLKEATVSAALVSLVGLFSPHMMVMVLAAGLVMVLFHVVPLAKQRGGKHALLLYFQFSLVFVVLVAVLSFYWLLPAFTHKAVFLYQMGEADLEVFSARPLTPGGSVFLALASLHGFWRGGYSYITQILPGWYLLALFFIFLAVHGFLAKYRDVKLGSVVKTMGVIGIFSLLLGSGISSPFFSPIYEFLFDKLFFLRAFRDSQKLVALLVLAYAYLGGLGVAELYRQLRPRLEQPKAKHKIGSIALAAIALASPFAYSVNMLWGFKGQLKPMDYPVEWQEVNNFLNRQPGDFTTLFLPWHGFMTFSWSGQRVATPAKWFFDMPTLQSQSLEVGRIDNESTEPAQHYVGFLLQNKSRLNNLGELLAPLNIKYIILAKEADYKEYDFLFRQADLKVVMENSQLVLLENLHPVALFYTVDRLQPLTDWSQLLEASVKPGVDTLGAVFPLGEKANGEIKTDNSFQAIEYQRLSPVRYQLGTARGRYVAASLPYDPAWRFDNVSAMANLGLTNSFSISQAGQVGLLCYGRYGILLCSYIVSGVGLVVVILLLCISDKRHRKSIS